MRNFYKLLFIIMIVILTVSVVSAENIDSNDIKTISHNESSVLKLDSDIDNVVQSSNNDEVLSDGSINFTELQRQINEKGESAYITLTNDVIRVEGDSEINITSSIVSIDGDNKYKIDAKNLGGIFKVSEGSTLMLQNIVLVNANSTNGSVVYNQGYLNIYSSTFANNTASENGGVIYSEGSKLIIYGPDTSFINNKAKNGGVIYDGGSGDTFTVTGPVTFQNNIATENGGAIYSNGELIIYDFIFENNTAVEGGAIYSKGELTIEKSQFISNKAVNGSAISVVDASIVINQTTSFTENIANEYGTIYVNNSTYEISVSNFSRNNAKSGGALYLTNFNQNTNNLSDCIFEENNAEIGAAICFNYGGEVIITNCEFISNEAFSNGVIYAINKLIVNSSKFYNNTGSSIYTANELYIRYSSFNSNKFTGNGSAIQTTQMLTISDSNFTLNSASNGGAIYSTASSIISNVMFDGNSATNNGGAIYTTGDTIINNVIFTNNSAVNGAAIYVTSLLSIDKTNFINNVANNNGIIYAIVTITINNTNVTNNSASNGGALYVKSASVENTYFTNNSATTNGGAIYSSGTTTLDNVYFTNNTATKGSAIYISDGTSEVKNSEFIENKATNDAGAIYTNATLNITNALFINNTALNGGAIRNKGKTTIENSIFTDNTATIGNAIYNEGNLTLSGNTINNETPDIYDEGIISKLEIIVMNNLTYIYDINQNISLNATITDIDGNLINSTMFVFIFDNYTIEAKYNETSKQYEAFLEDPQDIDNIVTVRYKDENAKYEYNIKNATLITIKGSYYDLQRQINNTEYELNLTYNFTYNPIVDNNSFSEGIIINKTLTINANDLVINANNLARIFNVIGNLTLINATLCNANVNNDDGAAVYVNKGAKFNAVSVRFTNNTAYKCGGAIYSEGIVNINNSLFDNNDIINRNDNEYDGGAAIYNLNGTLTVNNTNITNNLKNIIIPNDKIAGAVVTNDETLIENSYFANNKGYFGGAISSLANPNGYYNLMIKNSIFEKNNATFGGSIYILNSKLHINNSLFINNTADVSGGAIRLNEGYQYNIENSKFENNKVDNAANSIELINGDLSLKNNTINNSSAEIINYNGKIISKLNIIVLEGKTFIQDTYKVNLNATIKDDNANLINDKNFKFTIDNNNCNAEYKNTSKQYEATYTLSAPGSYNVSVIYITNDNLNITNATIKCTQGTFTDLQNKIQNAENELNLTYNFTYYPEIDGVAFVRGIVVNKTLTINANTNVINAINHVRIFNVTGNLTLINATLCNANVNNDDGAAVYVNKGAKFNAVSVRFTNNTAYKCGGAIYSEGIVNINNSLFDNNDIINRNDNEYDGGAAIYNLNGTLTVNNTNITNNLKNIIIPNDKIAGAVVTNDETLIENSYFANNKGYFGGAISSLTNPNGNYNLTIKNSIFEKNNAISGGSIFVQSSNLIVDNSRFTNNNCIGSGSEDTSSTQGAAILIMSEGSSAIITSSIFINNTADLGGAVSLSDVDGVSFIDKCLFINNIALTSGGAIHTSIKNTLNITNSLFENNSADCAGAIYYFVYGENVTTKVDNVTFENNIANLTGAVYYLDTADKNNFLVNNAIFNNNKANNGDGGALWIYNSTTTINNTKFTNNKAYYYGGVLVFNSVSDKSSLNISKSEFINNTAGWNGGVITLDGGCQFNIENSKFESNKEGNVDNSILLLSGDLSLKNNTILGSNAEIVNSGGRIISKLNIIVLEGKTFIHDTYRVNLNATVKDDNGNLINDENFKFIIDGNNCNAKYRTTSKQYEATYTLSAPGSYNVSVIYVINDNLNITNGTINCTQATFTDLQNKIENAENELNLTYNFTYYPEMDEDKFINGIIINKTLNINGNGCVIDAQKFAGIFNITLGKLTLTNATLTNANATNGAAILVNDDSELTVKYVNFINNTVNELAGAIYSNGITNVDYCIFDGNEVSGINTVNYGGAVIYSGGILTVNHTKVINNLKNIQLPDGETNKLVAAISSSGVAIIDNTYFANNTGYYSGALSSHGDFSSLKTAYMNVSNSYFENNNATFGGAIFMESTVFVVDNSLFVDNHAVDFGSENTVNTQGGAIFAHQINIGGSILNCNFSNNSAKLGGAISFCEVNGNVSNSVFSGNTATEANAIYNQFGNLSLSNNIINRNNADIVNVNGTIISKVNAIVLDNKTIPAEIGNKVTLNATLKDDNGNLIHDTTLKFIVDNKKELYTINATYNNTENIYIAQFTIKNAGLTSVTVSFDDRYVETATFDIPKSNAILNLSVDNITFGDNVTIIVNLTGVDELLNATAVVIVNGTDYNVNITNGTGNLTIEGFAIGSYPVTALFNGDSNYNGVYASGIFYVKGNSTLIITEIEDAVYGDSISVNVNLIDNNNNNLTGIVVATIGEVEYRILVDNGEGFITLEMLDAGDYTVLARYEGDNLHNATVNDTISFKIMPRPITKDNVTVEFNVTYNDINAPVNVTVIITAVDGNYTVKVDNEKYNVEVINGTGNVTFQSTRGNKTANITLNSNNYNLTEFSQNFVYKALPEFNVTFSGIYPTANITVNGSKGIYNVTINNQSVLIEVTDDIVTSNITNLNAGDYNVTVIFMDNVNYTERVKNYEMTVAKAIPEFVANVTGNLTYPNEVKFNITGTNGTYIIKINETVEFEIFVENNTIIEVIGLLNANIYNDVNVTYKESDNYNETSKLINFTVEKGTPNIKVNITVSGDTIYPGEITVVITSDIEGKYNLTVAGETKEIDLTIGNVYFEKYTNIAAGTHNVTINFTDNGNYKTTVVNREFVINKATPDFTIEVENVTYNSDVVITIKGTNGTYIITGDNQENVEINLTNGENSVSLSNLAAKTYVFYVNYTENENYTNVLKEFSFTVNKNITSIIIEDIANVTYNESVIINFTVVNPVNVSWTIFNGDVEVQKGTGEANITTDILAAGTFTIKITNHGNENYTDSNATATFTINKAASTIVIDEIANVTYSNNLTIKFSVENITSVNWTIFDVDGNIVREGSGVNITGLLLAAGDYTIIIENTESENVTGFSIEYSFKVNKADSLITIYPFENVTYGNDLWINFIIDNFTGVFATIYTVDYVKVHSLDMGEIEDTFALISNLDAGDYFITIENDDSENITGYSIDVYFTIFKVTPSITVDVLNVTYGSDVVVNVTSDVSGNFVIKVGEDTQDIILEANTSKEVIFKGFNADTYDINVIYDETTNYNYAFAESSVTVFKQSSSVVIGEIINVTVPNKVIIPFAVVNRTMVTINISSENEDKLDYLLMEDGNIVFEGDVGIYTVIITNEEFDNIEESSDSAVFTINPKANSLITIDSFENVTYGNDLNITFTVDNLTSLSATIYTIDSVLVRSLEMGEIEDTFALISNLDAGEYYITILNSESENISSYYVDVYFTIFKAIPSITVDVLNVTYGSDVVVNVTSDVSGNYVIKIGETTQDIILEANTSKKVIFKGFNADTYDINVTYDETINYNETFVESSVTVFKQSSNVVIGEIINVTASEKVIIPFAVVNRTTVLINISSDVEDKLDYSFTSDGNIIFEGGVGNYTIIITNSETENVESSSNMGVFSIKSGKKPLNVTVTAINGTTSQIPTFKVEVPDNYKGKVDITVNGKTITCDVNKEVAFNKLSAGQYNATMKFYGSDDYDNATVSVSFDVYVTSTIISSNLLRAYNSPYDFRATFTDKLGKALANINVLFIIDGIEYIAITTITDSNGVANITLKLPVGTYHVTSVSFDGSKANNTLKIVPRITGNKALSMYYDDGSTYKVKIIGDNGKAVGAGQIVKFKLNNKITTVKTNSKGYASLKITLPPKTYTITAQYKGYKVSNKISVKSHFISKSKSTIKRKIVNKKGYLSIKYNMGKYFSGKKVTLKFPNKKYVVKVDKKGKLTFKINKNVVNKLKIGKKYTYMLIYKLDKKSRHVKVYRDKFVFTS